MLTGVRGVDLGVRDVAAQTRFYTDVWRLAVVAAPPPSERMKSAQRKIGFAGGLFRP